MILFINADKKLSDKINSTIVAKNKEVTSVFIDWVPTKKNPNQKNANNLLTQTETVEKYSKKTPIVIFDRYRSITDDEYNWLKKFKITFFEPAITPRMGFKYLPHWTKIKTLHDIQIDDTQRPVNIGYIGNLSDKLKSFDKYYTKTYDTHQSLRICYDSKDISPTKQEEYSTYPIWNKPLDFKDIEFTVIIGSYNDYIVGSLDQYYFRALDNNCIPVIPMENRYYSSLPFTACDQSWYDPYVGMYKGVYIGLIKEIYDKIKTYYPEMNIDYTAEVIKKYLGEK